LLTCPKTGARPGSVQVPGARLLIEAGDVVAGAAGVIRVSPAAVMIAESPDEHQL